MRYATLGRTGVKVSRFCLGAMMFGKGFNSDHDDCVRIIRAALDAGINFVDTADGYTWGESEQIVGKALRGRRDSIVLADQAGLPMAQLATAWAMEHPDVASVIIGPRTMQQFTDSLASADLRLDADLLDRIDDLVAPASDVNPSDQTARPAELEASYRRRPQ